MADTSTERLYEVAHDVMFALMDYVKETAQKKDAAPAELAAMTEAAQIVINALYR